MIAEVLRSMSGYSAWWFALYIGKTEKMNNREEVSRLSSVLGYSQGVLLVLFDIAGLVVRTSGGGYSVKVDKWNLMFSEYHLGNEVSHNASKGIFGGKNIYYLRIGKSKSGFAVKDQMKTQEVYPPRISKMKISRLMRDVVSMVLLDLKSFEDLVKEVEDVVETNMVEGEMEEVMEAEAVDDVGDGDAVFDESASFQDKPSWMKKANTINQSCFPILSRFGASISNVELSGLLSELVYFKKDLGEDMTFNYKNGREGLLLEVPKNKSHEYKHFREYSGRNRWFHKLLKHLGGDTDQESANEGAYLISRELCKEYETSTLLAVKEHGIPILEKMDEVTAGAMWCDAQVTIYQQRKILKYMRHSFGSKVIIPQSKVQEIGSGYVRPEFGIYYFRKTATTKPERCNYWTRCLPQLLQQSTQQLLEEHGGKRLVKSTTCKNHPLKAYQIGTKVGWELIVGADHGKGAWRSVVKVYYSDYEERRAQAEASKICWTDRRMDDEHGYFLLRNGHVDCRKDNEEILRNTVMRKMHEDFTKLLNSRMIAVKCNSQFEVFLISKYSQNINVVSKNSKSCVTYEIADNIQALSTMMIQETNLPSGGEICLDIPHFVIYFTGDLAYYADILGKPNSSPHWCHLCNLSHKEWNDVSNLKKGKLWCINTMQETYETYKQQQQAKKTAVKGIKNAMHFPNISPQMFVCPPLHILIGLVNKVWSEMMEWVNDDLENIEDAETNEREMLRVSNLMLSTALQQRDEMEKTTLIELKHQKVQYKAIQNALKK